MQAVAEEHGCELSDDAIVSHGAQSAIGHDSGLGRDRRRRAGGGRHLAARPRVALLRRHDAHVRGGRRRAAGGAGRVLAAHARTRCERVYADLRAGANGRALFERSCEPYIEAGQPTQLTKEPGQAARGRVLPRARARHRARGPRAPVHGPARRRAARRRRRHGRAGLLPARLRRLPARGSRASSPTTATRSSRTSRTSSDRSAAPRRSCGRARRVASSSSWVPRARTRPSSSTTIVSASITVESRCAIVTTAPSARACADAVVDRALGQPVDLGGGLVEQQHVGGAQDRAGERDPLALAAGDARPGQRRVQVQVLAAAPARITASTSASVASGRPSSDVLADRARHDRRLLLDVGEPVADLGVAPARRTGARRVRAGRRCGSRKRRIRLNSVVLPAPDGPTIAVCPRRGISRLDAADSRLGVGP